MGKLTTMQLSIETKGKLYRIKCKLEKIVGKSLSYEDVVLVFLALGLERAIEDLMLES